MTKQEVQKRVLQNGKPLDLDKFEWDEKTNTFTTQENDLMLDFGNIDNFNFNTGSNCSFRAGSNCNFETCSNCNFITLDNCNFNTGSNCSFDTGSNCSFDTGSNCNFDKRIEDNKKTEPLKIEEKTTSKKKYIHELFNPKTETASQVIKRVTEFPNLKFEKVIYLNEEEAVCIFSFIE